MKKSRIYFLLLLLVLGGAGFWSMNGNVVSLSKKIGKKQRSGSLCRSLFGLPYADDKGIIRSVRTIDVQGVYAPLNASLLEDGEGFLLFFRYDIKEKLRVLGVETPFRQKIASPSKKMSYRTKIGAIRLDKNFQQIGEIKQIETYSEFSEDPRAIRAHGKIYVVYNDLQDNPIYSRSMHMVCLDPQTLDTLFVQDLDQLIHHVDQKYHVEKNWTPFVRQEEGEEKIFLEYGINPHKIMRMKSPSSSEMDHLVFPHHVALQSLPWGEKWGALRGGTPAILVKGHYLAFFHSLFYDSGRPWYVMGAYTFEAQPPYRVTALSSYPILFRGSYASMPCNTASSKKRILYPAGIVLGEQEGKEVVYVSVGENDSSIKILTFSLEELLSSLTPVAALDK